MIFVVDRDMAVFNHDSVARESNNSLDQLLGAALTTNLKLVARFGKHDDIASFRYVLMSGNAGPGSRQFPDD